MIAVNFTLQIVDCVCVCITAIDDTVYQIIYEKYKSFPTITK